MIWAVVAVAVIAIWWTQHYPFDHAKQENQKLNILKVILCGRYWHDEHLVRQHRPLSVLI